MENNNKPKFETPNGTTVNIDNLATLFPGVVTEGKVNFDLLRTMLGDDVFKDEAYEFTWVGKRDAIAEAGRPIRKTLRPVREDEVTPTGSDTNGNPYCSTGSVNWDTTENLYIEGDNLDVLKLLQESYLGKVKMIYIDPPYNTGEDSFVYPDNFTMSEVDYEEDVEMFDEDGRKLFKDNSVTNPRFHSDWCSMIYPRLMIARNMLKDDGVIFISIDDKEVSNLRKICDEVFGGGNFIAQFIWEKRTNRENRKQVSTRHEYVVCYVKSEQTTNVLKQLPMTEKALANYKNLDNDPRGLWKSDPATAQAGHGTKSQFYELTAPNGKVHKLESGRCWLFTQEVMQREIEEKRIWFGKDGNGVPRKKTYLNDKERGLTPESIIFAEDAGTTEIAKNKIKELFEGKSVFDTPKPLELLKTCLILTTSPEDVILDFFSGSSATAHAVMQLNAEDGGNRKFIMVQLPEVTDPKSEAHKADYYHIHEIGKERIRRAGKKIMEEWQVKQTQLSLNDQTNQSPPDIGFRVLKLDDTNMNDVYHTPGELTMDMLDGTVSNIKPDRTDMDLLYGCLLDWGLPLSMPHTTEQLDGHTIHTYNDGDLIACFDEQINQASMETIAKRKPLRAVFIDAGFTDSASKINVFEIFKLHAPNTSVKVI